MTVSFTKIKRNKTDNPTSENVSIDQANLSEQPSISKNDSDNHNIALTPNSNNSMSNDSDKTLTAGENDIGNYVHNLEIDDLKKELLKTPWVPHSTPCVLFDREKGGKGGHQKLGALVSKEYATWKNALQDFQLHAMNEGRSKNITEQLSIERSRQIEQNRNILLSVIKTIILCSKQEFALRGSNDFGNVMNINTFNFRALLRFRVDSGDTILEEHLKNGPKNSLYTSPGIQNGIISICGDIIKSKIIQRVNAAECFSVLADETTEGRIEQMSICLRYYDRGDKKIREDFLEFTPAVDLTGKGLTTLIMSSLQNNGINCQFLVGQGYDGASEMSGYLHGAQEYIKKEFPTALYVHCSAHSLNLALANASSLPTIRNCISTIQTVGTVFRSSAQRSEVLRISIIETLPQARHSTLVALCETRWVYKHESVLRFKELYPAIIVALEKLESSINKETAQKSCQLLSSIKGAKFVILLIIIENIFSYTLTLCKQLQTINADLVETCNHIDDVLAILDEIRENNNNHFSDMFFVAAIMMNKNKEEIDFPRFANRQTQLNNVPANSSEDKCIHSTSEEMNDSVQFYSRILTEPNVFKAEFSIWKSKWLKEELRPNTAIEALDNCNILLFPNLWKFSLVLATIPMSIATPERTFSSLKGLKTYLRNSTGETRINGLALMSIHREINVDPEEVLNRFAKQPRRIMLL
ncbi:52 kDa repressor of the inhibitor of the protein kinase-like [Aphis gossypii]|uniref:52 kDa repressor of the inhibitor of the protein kinase-like n=1 Tax=Aphis gossypii TaxID=80765 RepID=UPI0021598321|nr:52 kDa repressor of the inhibitor of the protein kinase-like [Aphis gossypii]